MSVHRVVAVAAALALTAGCGGPSFKLEGHLKEQPVSIKFGAQSSPTPPAPALIVPARNVRPAFPGVFTAPPVVKVPTERPAPEPVACPVAEPFAFPELPTRDVASSRPAAATYPFRYRTTVKETLPGGAVKTSVRTGTGTQQVRNVSDLTATGGYTFDLVERYDGTVTTTTLAVEPAGPVPPGYLPNNAPLSGIAIRAVTTQYADGSTDVFAPQSDLQVFPFPALRATAFRSAATDATSATTIAIDPGTVVDRSRVDACGDVIETWSVDLVGTLADAAAPQSAVSTFHDVFQFANQYGGLPVAGSLTQTYTCASGNPCTATKTFTISALPKLAVS